jgi:hypothetical protein
MAKYGKRSFGIQNRVTSYTQEMLGLDGQIICLQTFDCKMCNTEQGMMAEFDDQFVYRITPGVFCRSRNNGSAMLSMLAREPTIEKVSKYGMGKRSVGFMI